LHATRYAVVFLTNNQRVKLTRGGVKWIYRRVNTQFRDVTCALVGYNLPGVDTYFLHWIFRLTETR